MYIILNAIMFSAKIPFHTYQKYFDSEYENEKLRNTSPITIKIVFIAIEDDFERMMLKWNCPKLGGSGEIDENKFRDLVKSKIHTWITWNGRSCFSESDFL
tara:strand:- start:106 stop:408 length:303 start_codon:yes stop_codon:yes gene_type:complete